MKKFNYFLSLLCVACMFTSCHVGRYLPGSLNVGGTSTQVVLSQANFRVVRNIESVIEVNNTNLRRADVEKSAFAELMRKYPITGSQAYINVVVEEIRREGYNAFGLSSLKQYVAVRATIIEFLQSNGQPIQSIEPTYNIAPQRTIPMETQKEVEAEEIVQNEITVKNISEISVKDVKNSTADKYYIAWLMKTGKISYDKQKQTKLFSLFNRKELVELRNKYSANELYEKSKYYDKELELFAK